MRGWGHDLNTLNAAAVDQYEQQLSRSTAPGYIRQLLDVCGADGKLRALLDMLSAWGLQARLQRLDELAGSPQSGDSPQVMWQELESRVIAAEPTRIAQLSEPDGYDAGSAARQRRARRELQDLVAVAHPRVDDGRDRHKCEGPCDGTASSAGRLNQGAWSRLLESTDKQALVGDGTREPAREPRCYGPSSLPSAAEA